MAEKQHIEWLLEGVEAWNGRREQEDFQPDFEGANITSKLRNRGTFSNNEQNYPTNVNTKVFNPDLSNINLSDAKLSGAELYEANLANANFSHACLINTNLFDTNLSNTNFFKAKLIGAVLTDANLTGANLRNAILTNAELFDSDLIGADLSHSKPWKAKLYSSSIDSGTIQGAAGEEQVKKKIKSIECLLKECRALRDKYKNKEHSDNILFYFRGEALTSYKLRPSVMRSRKKNKSEENKSEGDKFPFRKSEGEMLLDLMSRQPEAFSGLTLALGQWVLAQHHRLKMYWFKVNENFRRLN